MVNQEEKAMARIQKVASLIDDLKEMSFDDLAAWTQINMGITEKTTGRYINALAKMGVISFDAHTNEIKWLEKK